MLWAGTQYDHTSTIAHGRALWMRSMIANASLSAAVSMDADTWFTDPPGILRGIGEISDSEWAMGILPVRIARTGKTNIARRDTLSKTGLAFIDWPELADTVQIAAGGFGIVIFNLAWFRERWSKPEPEHISMTVGEDIGFCRSVTDRGGRIRLVNVATHHAEFVP